MNPWFPTLPPAISPQALIGGPECARGLVGQLIVRQIANPAGGSDVSIAQILETEFYGGTPAWPDPASYAQRGLAKGKPMWGTHGRVYFVRIRGNFFGFNVIAEPEGQPGAILITAIECINFNASTAVSNGSPTKTVVRGPHKVCQALAIDQRFEGHDLTRVSHFYLAASPTSQRALVPVIQAGLRRGIADDKLWRFYRSREDFHAS